jgi:hypothetical protein
VLLCCHRETRKQVFESPHRIAHCGLVIRLVDFSQIGYVRLSPKPDFQSASSRYGDKWLVTRGFSRFFFRVTLPDIPRSKAAYRSILMVEGNEFSGSRVEFQVRQNCSRQKQGRARISRAAVCGAARLQKRPGSAGLFDELLF